MDILEINRKADSVIKCLEQTVETLKSQGHDIGIRVTPNKAVFVGGVIKGQVFNDAFFPDNQESIDRMVRFNREIRNNIYVPSEQGSSFSKAAS